MVSWSCWCGSGADYMLLFVWLPFLKMLDPLAFSHVSLQEWMHSVLRYSRNEFFLTSEKLRFFARCQIHHSFPTSPSSKTPLSPAQPGYLRVKQMSDSRSAVPMLHYWLWHTRSCCCRTGVVVAITACVNTWPEPQLSEENWLWEAIQTEVIIFQQRSTF